MKKNIYITTTLPYVNSIPHIGFASEIVAADVFARAQRLAGNDVFFTTGTDEHGQKIADKAKEEGVDVQEYVDAFSSLFYALRETLNISFDNFIRTTNPVHVRAAQEFWKRCDAAGDIYKKSYEGLYCVGCEMFLRESDIENGRCKIHPNLEPQHIVEENYFFRLSKYHESILAYLKEGTHVLPEFRRDELISFMRDGLEDVSISRSSERLTHGIPVPGDQSQVMYVWFDALTNYISTLGWPDDAAGAYKKYWEQGEKYQFAGKDQLRFQSILWQAMLMSAGLPLTDMVFYRGHITLDGRKMSKSFGNIIAPHELVEKYGVDATRYMLTRHVHPYDDTDISWDRMDNWYTSHLVHGLGNLVARILKMSETYLNLDEISLTGAEPDVYGVYLDMEDVWRSIGLIDAKITATLPFKVVKQDEQEGKRLIAELVSDLRQIALRLRAVMPSTAEKILLAIAENKKPENLFLGLAS